MAGKIYSIAIQQKYWLEDEEVHFYKLNQHWLFDTQLVVCQREIKATSVEGKGESGGSKIIIFWGKKHVKQEN